MDSGKQKKKRVKIEKKKVSNFRDEKVKHLYRNKSTLKHKFQFRICSHEEDSVSRNRPAGSFSLEETILSFPSKV